MAHMLAPKQPLEKSYSRKCLAWWNSAGDGAGHFHDVDGGVELVIQELH